jgi:two-component system cell cycle sensor histidine kinase/response regulator CckA
MQDRIKLSVRAEQEDQITSPKTVLLVQDEAPIRNWIHGELEKIGFNLLEAANGADALLIAELHQGPIDLVVTDIVMPNVTGPELVKALHKIRPNAQVLYISGFPEPFIRATTTLPPGTNCLAKPFALPELLTRIHDLLK